MTDNDVIKALECCTGQTNQDDACVVCPFLNTDNCMQNEKLALELIKRQQAENSNLTSDLTSLQRDLTSAKAEIKRLETEINNNDEGKGLILQIDGANGYFPIEFIKESIKTHIGIDNIKFEARKEFAERTKEKLRDIAKIDFKGGYYYLIGEAFFDNLLMELDGKENGND